MVVCQTGVPHLAGNGRCRPCLRPAASRRARTGTTTRSDRSRGPGRPRPTAVPDAITRSGRTRRTWWSGGSISGRPRSRTDGTGTRRAGRTGPSGARPGSGPRSSVRVGCRLDEFDEHAARVLGMDEVDPRVCRASTGGVIQQPHALVAESLRQRVEIANSVSELLNPWAALVDE